MYTCSYITQQMKARLVMTVSIHIYVLEIGSRIVSRYHYVDHYIVSTSLVLIKNRHLFLYGTDLNKVRNGINDSYTYRCYRYHIGSQCSLTMCHCYVIVIVHNQHHQNTSERKIRRIKSIKNMSFI